MNEELKIYWQYLRDNNADVPDTFESFHRTLQDDVSAKKYYDYLKEQGFDAPDTFESFSNTLGLKKKESTGGFTTSSPILDQESPLGSKDYLNQLTYKPEEEPVVGTIPVTPLDPSEQRAETFLANENLKDQLEQGRKEYESQKNAQQRSDFGMMNLDEIDAELAKKSPPVFNQPSVEPGSTDIQSQLKVPVSQIDLDVNKFESKKDNIRDLKVKADKAAYADELKKFSETAISKIDKELAKMPSNISFEDTGMGGVSVPQKDEKQQILEMAREILQEVKDSPDKGGFWEGFGSKGFVGMLPFVSGLEELPKLKKIRDVSLEAQPGDKENELRAFMGEEQVDNLAPEKRQLLSAAAIRQEFERAKEQPGMYRFGRVLAEMAPYMGEYVATAGAYSAARTTVVKGLESVLKGAAKKTVIRNGVIKPISTLIGVASQTAANPTRIAATTMERMTPQLKATLALDPDELKGVVGEDGEKFTEAFVKAFGTSALEILTERFGQWSNEAADAIKASGYWLPNITLARWMEKRGFINLAQANKAAKTLGWDGIFQEIYLEEYPNKMLQEAVTGDQNILSDLAKDGPPTKETLEFFNPLSQEFIDMMIPSLILSGGPMAYGAFKKWATKPDPTVMEEVLKGPVGDIKDVEKLTEKLRSSEKPKEPTRPVAAAEVPKAKTQESVPVQGEQEKQSKERKKILINTLLDTDDVDHSFETAGYTNKEGFWVEPGAENQFGQLSEETKAILKKNGIVFIGNSSDRKDIAGAAGGLKVYEGGKSKTIRGIHLTDHGENYAGHDKVAVHEAAHSVWSDLDKATQDLFNDGNPITDHGKEYKKGDERYKAVYGANQDQLGEEDFAELFALNRGDLEKTISDKKKQGEQEVKGEEVKPVENKAEKLKQIGATLTQDEFIEQWKNIPIEETKEVFAEKGANKSYADLVAVDNGFDNSSHAVNSINKRTGEKYRTIQEIPSSVLNKIAKERVLDKTPSFKRFFDIPAIGFKHLSDLSKSESFIKKGFSGLDIPSQRFVEKAMLLAGNDTEVLNSIVSLIPVNVVDMLRLKNLSPEMLFHDKSVLLDFLTPDLNNPISGEIEGAGSFIRAVADFATKHINSSDFIKIGNMSLSPTEGDTTVSTDDINETGTSNSTVSTELSSAGATTKGDGLSLRDESSPTETTGDTIHETNINKKSGNIPKEQVKKQPANERNLEELPPAEEKGEVSDQLVNDYLELRRKDDNDALSKAAKKNGIDIDNLSATENDAFYKKVIKRFIEGDLPNKRWPKAEKLTDEGLPGGSVDIKPVDKPVKKVSKEESLREILSEDDLRPAMQGIYYDKEAKKIVATNGYSLVTIGEKNISETRVEDLGGRVIDEKYPDYKSVIPKDNPIKIENVDVSEWLSLAEGATKAAGFFRDDLYNKNQGYKQGGNYIKLRISAEGTDIFFNPVLLGRILKVFKANGVDNITVSYSKPNRGMLLEGGEIVGLAMPVSSTADYEVPDTYVDLPVNKKPKITQIKEANPERILVVKPTSDTRLKEVSKDKYQADSDKILVTVTRSQKPGALGGMPFWDVAVVNKENGKATGYQWDSKEKALEFAEDAIKAKDKPRKSDAKFDKARKSAAELLDLIGPGLKIDEKYDSEKGQKIIIKAGEVVANYIDAGVTRFAEMLQDIYETYGEKGLRMMFEPMKKGYGSQMASVSDEVANEMDDLKTVRGTKIEDILKTTTDEQTGTTTNQPGGRTGSGITGDNETEQAGGTKQGELGGSQGTSSEASGDGTGVEGSLPEPGDDTTGSPQGGDTGRIRPELADADVQHNFVYPENWERNKNKTFSKKQAYKDNIAALEVINTLLDNPELFATDAQKQILSRYNGLGPLGEILLPADKKRWNQTQLEHAELSDRLKELLKQIGEKTKSDPLATAESSTQNAFYTSLPVIRAIWKGIQAGGFNGGKMLEGSVGSGRFIGGMPPSIMDGSRIKGVDMDIVSGLITHYLYPKISVVNSPIQEASLPSNYYDLFVSNIPFGTNHVYDPLFKERGGLWAKSMEALHSYFFAKAIDTVRPGGYVAIVTSSAILDTPSNQYIRDLINNETEFIGAVRLSEDAFNADAGTSVITDVILLRKKLEPSKSDSQISSLTRKKVKHKYEKEPDQEIRYNEYFDKNPDHVFGDEWLAGGLYSADSGYTIKGKFNPEDVGTKLAELTSKLPILPKTVQVDSDQDNTLQISPLGRMVSGGIVEKDGEYYTVLDYDKYNQKYTVDKIKNPAAKDMPILKSFVDIKNNLFSILADDTQGQDATAGRTKLKEQLKEFAILIKPKSITTFGDGAKAIERLLVKDPDFYAVTSLINEDGSFAGVVTNPIKTEKQEFTETTNAQEAIGYSINTYGKINVPFIQKVMGAETEQEAIDLMQDEIFETPDEVVEKSIYLSGNVAEKLKQAKEWLKQDKKYDKNVKALTEVLPTPLAKDQITFQVGASWIPLEYTQQFLDSVFGEGLVIVRHEKTTDNYEVITDLKGGEYEASDDEGNIKGIDVVVKAALTKSVSMFYKTEGKDTRPLPQLTQSVRDKADRLQDEFAGLIAADQKMGEELSEIYNELFNGIVNKQADGSKLTFPGWTHPVFSLLPHQKDAIMLMVQRMGGMIDHIVGGGKSFIMGAGAIKMKQLGLVNKPMITTMKSVVPGMVKDIKAAYPSARILAPTEADFSPSKRQRLFAKIANNDWDLIIITHEALNKVPLPLDFQQKYIGNEIEELKEALDDLTDGGDKKDKWLVQQAKAVQKKIDNLKAKLKEIQDKGKHGSRTDFGTMGIDMLFVDESQQFKNLEYITKLRGVAGLGNPAGSGRAANLKMVSRYLQDLHGGDKGVAFASGTPISNSLVEVYGIFQYLRPSLLKKLKMNSLDQFIKTFAKIETLMEANMAGVIKMKTRLSGFVNVADLASLYTEISDIRGTHNLKIERPDIKGGAPRMVTVPQSETVKRLSDAIRESSSSGTLAPLTALGVTFKGDAEKSIGLVLTTFGTKISSDPRLAFPKMKADGGKVFAVADEIKKIYDKTKDIKGTQLVFADMGVPKDKKASIGIRVRDQIVEMHGPEIINEISGLSAVFSLKDENEIKQRLMELMEIDINEANEILIEANDVNSFSIYQALKDVLIEQGIPEKEIAFIHDAKNDKQKDDLFDNFKKGNVRVLVGSTEKMGTGVNVQTRVVAMHHIDIKWRPSDLEQRNGRGIRRGNMNKEVEIIYYGTDQMPIDSYRFSLNGLKQLSIDTFRAGAIGIREMDFEDGESMTMSEFSAMLSGDDRMLKLDRLKQKAIKLKNRVDSVRRSNSLREKRIRDANKSIDHYTERLKAGDRIVNYVKDKIKVEEIEEEVLDVEATEKKGKDVIKKTKAEVAVFDGTVDGDDFNTGTFTDRKKFYEALKDNISYITGENREKIGSIGDLIIYAQKSYDRRRGSSNSVTKIWVELKGDSGYSLDVIQNSEKPDALRIRIGMLSMVRGIDSAQDHDKWYLKRQKDDLKATEAVPEAKVKEKDVEELREAETERDALDAELRAEAKENSAPVAKKTEEENKPLSDMIKDISDLGSEQYKDIDGMAMTSFIPGLKPKGKVRVKPNNSKLIAHVVSKNAQATPEQQLQEAIKFNDPEVQKRFDESRVWTSQNMESFFGTIKDWAKGFSQHFKYLNAKAFPREANILREFETLNKWAKGEATRYMKGLVSPLTPEQYTIFSNRIILADLLGSIKRGENMAGLDGKYPFGLSSVQEIDAEFAKYDELMKADPAIEKAFNARENFMEAFKQELISSGLLEENEIDDYYHRRVLEYQHDSLNENILFGKTIGDKKRSFQKRRTGTRGMDYNTNFIETEFKVVSEGLFELEKQKILKDLMAPYEVQLKELEKQFKAEFDKKMKELEDQYGPDSEEVKIHNDSKRALKRNYLNENIPDGYVFWRVSEENRLFWGKTVTQKVIDNALQAAADNDQSGMSDAMKVVDDLVGSMEMGLMVGSKRKQYMVPKELAQQLEELAKDKELPIGSKIVNNITSLWKRHTLLFPTRIVRYNLNNLGGDIDRTLQVEPAILKYGKESFKELYDYYTTGKTTDQLLEAMRGDIISSGFQISELSDLKKEDWVKWVDSKSDLTVEKVMGKEWVKANAIAIASKPADLYNKYMDAATKIIEFREGVLRFAAYKLAAEKAKKGVPFYWASDPKQIDKITDERQRIAKLSREVYGDYSNISITGQELRRNLLPFYSWAEINMKTHWQLIKNASSPEVQRRMIATGLAKGLPVIAVKFAWAYTKLALFTVAIHVWNRSIFPWIDDDDDKDDPAYKKLVRSTIKGMQVIVDVDPETGFIKTLPIQGTFYDFLDFMGIPNAWSDVSDLVEQDKPVETGQLFEVPKNMVGQTVNRTSQMITPFAKMMFELPSKVKYFPDVWNPIPFRDRWEYVAETVALKDEYNYIFSDAPKKEGYWKRKWNNSLFLREFDTELLAYYATKKIIREYKGGATGYEPGQNKVDQDKSKAAYYYALSKRYGNTEAADKYLNQFIEMEIKAIGQEYTSTGSGTAAALSKLLLGTGNNPAKDLSVLETNDLVKLFADPEYKPMTAFGKSLTPREIAIMKDGTRFYNRISGFEGPNALFIKK